MSYTPEMLAIVQVLSDVAMEREKQDAKWGAIRDHPDGTGDPEQIYNANVSRMACDLAFKFGVGTWANILQEEVDEALAESDAQLLHDELIQVAAVAACWAQALRRRMAEAA